MLTGIFLCFGLVYAGGTSLFDDGFETGQPVILSEPPTSAMVGVLYEYDVDAVDFDDDPLTYMLTVSPAGMTINPTTGLIQWTPTMAGSFPVTASVDDNNQGPTLQSWTIMVADNGIDTDSDGLSDDFEMAIGTDPDDSDTDDDGLSDGDEVLVHGSDPLNPDTDQDGLTDGDEVDIHSTEPTEIDTDGDFFGDGFEILAGTDPLNPADFPAGSPDPQALAPANDPTVTTTLHDSIEFLFNGTPPIQTGVTPNFIEPIRVAVLRGQVQARNGDPLPGVTVTVEDQPDLGMTESRVDGRWDLAVNGGGSLSLRFEITGYLPAQRTLDVPWQQYVELDDVVLIPLDAQSTNIDLTVGGAQLAMATPSNDSDGMRQAAMIIPDGTTAELQLEGGGTMPVSNLTIRATEYTVGDAGPATMPAILPPSSGYTYAVELSADEAMAPGFTGLSFNQPVFSYTENFLGFPVGTAVPAGYYDFNLAAWVPSLNGLVIEILGETGGLADIDIDGDGIADVGMMLTELGFTEAERIQLASTYPAPQELWRVPVEHFTPWDYNWPYGPPLDAEPPNVSGPRRQSSDVEFGQCSIDGSIIETQDQVLREEIPVAGTPFYLTYNSKEVPGRTTGRTANIPLSGSSVPASLERIDLRMSIAGQKIRQSFAPLVDQETTFTWNGRDAYGRDVYGRQLLRGSVNFVYEAEYYDPGDFEAAFAQFGEIPLAAVQSRQEIVFPAPFSVTLENFDARNFGIAGWRLNVHHAYDPVGKVLITGDGLTRGASDALQATVITFAGDTSNENSGFSGDGGPATGALMDSPTDVAMLSDGSVLITDRANERLRMVDPAGIISTIAGTGVRVTSGDGGPASAAGLWGPRGVAVGPDGSIYITQGDHRIRRIAPDGIITTFAGDGSGAFGGDGGPAIDAGIDSPTGITVAHDGTIYFVEDSRVRQIDPSGIIQTIAGTGFSTHSGDGGPAALAGLRFPADVAVATDGSIFIAVDRRVRRIGRNGIINTVAGNGFGGYSGDGGPAVNAGFEAAISIAFDNDALFIADTSAGVIRKVTPDGIITSVAGMTDDSNPGPFLGDGGPPLAALFGDLRGLAVDQDGRLLIVDENEHDIRRLERTVPGFSDNDIGIASADGAELYQFNQNGKHLRTFNSLTGAVLYEFTYDSGGLLESVIDGDGKITSIQRDVSGNPISITAPFGQQMVLSTDVNGFLNGITNPAGETYEIDSNPKGLIHLMEDPRGRISTYVYDENGRLTAQSDNSGFNQTLTRMPTASGFEIENVTALGRTNSYSVESNGLGHQINTHTLPDSSSSHSVYDNATGTLVVSSSAGDSQTLQFGADPVFGRLSQSLKNVEIVISGGPTMTGNVVNEGVLSDPLDPMSLVSRSATVTVDGRVTTHNYLAGSQTQTITSPEGREIVVSTDSQGRMTFTQEGDLAPINLTYTTLGQLETVVLGTGPQARETSFTYNSDGYLETTTDPLGLIFTYQRDSIGRVTNKNLPGNIDVQITWNTGGQVESIIPPGQPAHEFTYTLFGALDTITPPAVAGTGPTTFSYNDDRQLTEIMRAGGEGITLAHDPQSRIESLTFVESGMPGEQFDYTYLSAGRIDTITGPGTQMFAFNYQGDFVSGESWSGQVEGDVSWTFDSALRLASETVTGGSTINFSWDDDDLLVGAGDFSMTRNLLNGRPESATLGVTEDLWVDNDFAETTSYTASANASPVYELNLVRNDAGRLTQRIETIGGVTTTNDYGYDLRGQLTEVQVDMVVVESYTYDDNGNRLNGTTGGVSSDGIYDDQDRLVTYGGASFAYSPSGKLITRTDPGPLVTTYDYDPMGHLRAVSLPDGTSITYRSDGLHRRVERAVDGIVTQRLIYDGFLPVAELDGMNNVVSQFVYAGRHVPTYMISGGVNYKLVTDQVGSVRLVIDSATGNIVQRLDYDSFGRILMDTNPGFQPFGFAGGIYDPLTGLVRFGRRDYDPSTGRWTTRDPSGFGGGDTNLYRYVYNAPLRLIDPAGGEGIFDDIIEPIWSKFNELTENSDEDSTLGKAGKKSKKIKGPIDKFTKYRDKVSEYGDTFNEISEIKQDPQKNDAQRGRDIIQKCKVFIEDALSILEKPIPPVGWIDLDLILQSFVDMTRISELGAGRAHAIDTNTGEIDEDRAFDPYSGTDLRD